MIPTSHYHRYKQHPKYPDMVYCVVCGMAIPKSMLDYAIRFGATFDSERMIQ